MKPHVWDNNTSKSRRHIPYDTETPMVITPFITPHPTLSHVPTPHGMLCCAMICYVAPPPLQVVMDILGVAITCITCNFILVQFASSL